jgi:pilus assembly protein Flp/PilA
MAENATAIIFSSKLNDPKHLLLKVVGHHFEVPNPAGGAPPMPKFVAFLKNESGATAIEYGLIAAGISIAIIAVVNGLGTQLNATFTSVSTQLH